MKFMKLGSKPDTFYTAEAVRSVSSEVSSDIIIQVKGNRYLLHKFPLLSKCALLQKLCSESPYDPSSPPHPTSIHLPDFPGGAESFELCAKFCYGITITLSAHNIVAARCAAEYLQMTEDTEKGNLIHKLEVFLTSCVLQGWKDAIVALQSTKSFSVWAEDLGITGRCIDAVATKVLSRPSKVSLSHSYSRRGGGREDGGLPCRDYCNGGDENGTKQGRGGWWAEDLAELGIDLYWRTMIAIKSGGRVPSGLIGEALQIYAFRWFPTKQQRMMGGGDGGGEGNNCNDNSNSSEEKSTANKHRLLLESIVSLLPAEKGAVPCSFLLKLLKAANMLGASSSSKMELARRVGIQLEEATVKDLLIPSSISSSSSASKFSCHQNQKGSVGDNPSTTTKYDVDVVMSALEQFMAQGQQSSPPTSPPRGLKGRYERRRRSRSAENIDVEFQESRRSSSASHGAKFKVARLVDGYLREIASDPNLPLAKMIAIAECVPDFARVDHDDLYRAVDTYLKAHPDLNKSERKRLCRILDCRRLSMEACMHAAQNELLPLRVVVQVLFFEHARATKAAGGKVTDLPPNIKAIIGGRRGDEELDSLSSSRTGVAAPPPLSSATTTVVEDQWSVSGKIRAASSPMITSKSKVPATLKMKLQDEDETTAEDFDGLGKAASKLKNFCSMPAGPKRMFCRLLSVNRSASERR